MDLNDVPDIPPDPIFGVTEAFAKDKDERKVNLSVGAYRNNQGKPQVFGVVREAEKELLGNEKLDKEYLPIDGLSTLKSMTQELLFSASAASVKEGRVCSVQSISGTGALRLASEFVFQLLEGPKVVYISDPTWLIHRQIFSSTGFKVLEYPYWMDATRTINVQAMVECLRCALPNSFVILHTCAHNPTGMDPTMDDWLLILEVIKERKLIPLLDTAYQGFASGNLDDDAAVVRLFEKSGVDLFVCQSFAKTLGVYGERIGMLHIVCPNPNAALRCLNQLKRIIRCIYSSPPLHSGRLLAAVFSSPDRLNQWKVELRDVAFRLKQCRRDLFDGLTSKGTPGRWNHIVEQRGMFSYTGLSKAQCERLTNHWRIYLLNNGRISLAGLNDSNMNYVVNAIDEVVRELPCNKD